MYLRLIAKTQCRWVQAVSSECIIIALHFQCQIYVEVSLWMP